MTFIAQPVRSRAADTGRHIMDNPIGPLRGNQRTLQKSDGDRRKQCDRKPIKDCYHSGDMARLLVFGKQRHVALWVLGLALCGCSADAPVGQVIARIDDTEITQREFEQELTSRELTAGRLSTEQRNAALAALVDRKILVGEAIERSLEREAKYHFELRRAREILLLEALDRDLRSKLTPPTDAEVAAYIARQPWRFGNGFSLELSTQDTSGRTVSARLDSFVSTAAPSSTVQHSRPGEQIVLDGQTWRVDARDDTKLPMAEQMRLARIEMDNTKVEDQLRRMVADHRQTGRIVYQGGYGPAAR